MKLLKIDPLNQHDRAWKDKLLGGIKGETLDIYGCLLTCLAMKARYYGFDVSPQDINNWCIQNEGFENGDLYKYGSFPREFAGTGFNSIEKYPMGIPAKTDSIDKYLDLNMPVTVEVDFDRNSHNGVQMHFVEIVGKDDSGRYIINDPWTGKQTTLDEAYGKPQDAIFQIVLISGTPTASAPVATPIKVRVTADKGVNARTNPITNAQNIAKVYTKGTELEVVSKSTGDTVTGNNNWYLVKDNKEQYYIWSGSVEEVTAPPPPAVQVTPVEPAPVKPTDNVIAATASDAIDAMTQLYEVSRDYLISHNALPDTTTQDKTPGSLWQKIKNSLHLL